MFSTVSFSQRLTSGGGGVGASVAERIHKEVQQRTKRHVPVVLTSADSRIGGVEVWSVLLDALSS